MTVTPYGDCPAATSWGGDIPDFWSDGDGEGEECLFAIDGDTTSPALFIMAEQNVGREQTCTLRPDPRGEIWIAPARNRFDSFDSTANYPKRINHLYVAEEDCTPATQWEEGAWSLCHFTEMTREGEGWKETGTGVLRVVTEVQRSSVGDPHDRRYTHPVPVDEQKITRGQAIFFHTTFLFITDAECE